MRSRWLLMIFAFAWIGSLSGGSMACADQRPPWKKHTVMTGHHCNTAIALDANEDGLQDVIASFAGRVSLFIAPKFDREFVLHSLSQPRSGCIHSSVLDIDGDGDLDWAGAVATQHPFWLENPGALKNPGALENSGSNDSNAGRWKAHPIDDTITGIHCLTAADINNDGQDDLVINNFEPEKGLGDSIAWFSVPEDVCLGNLWKRHVFADRDARGGSHYMGIGDVDGDGWKEIAVGAKGKPFEDGNWFAYWAHPGEPNATGPWEKNILAQEQIGATNILPADVNEDGKLDWIASRGHGRGVLWLENPTWKIHPIDDMIESPHSLAVGDFDQDGHIDAATCGFGSEELRMYFNDGTGKFTQQTLDVGQQSYDLRSLDMDSDGDLDLLNAGRGTQNVVWYENPLR